MDSGKVFAKPQKIQLKSKPAKPVSFNDSLGMLQGNICKLFYVDMQKKIEENDSKNVLLSPMKLHFILMAISTMHLGEEKAKPVFNTQGREKLVKLVESFMKSK